MLLNIQIRIKNTLRSKIRQAHQQNAGTNKMTAIHKIILERENRVS